MRIVYRRLSEKFKGYYVYVSRNYLFVSILLSSSRLMSAGNFCLNIFFIYFKLKFSPINIEKKKTSLNLSDAS